MAKNLDNDNDFTKQPENYHNTTVSNSDTNDMIKFIGVTAVGGAVTGTIFQNPKFASLLTLLGTTVVAYNLSKEVGAKPSLMPVDAKNQPIASQRQLSISSDGRS